MNDFAAFGEMERSGWSDPKRVSEYVKLFSSASNQAIGSLLDAVGAKSGQRALDLCCGHGNVSEALVSRGCHVVGVDFSPAMLALARERVPAATLMEADAQHLPFEDAKFDVVVSNFGMPHVPDQPRALSEVRRVLRPGGRFAMTVWCGPDVSPCFAALYEVVRGHGDPGVSPPPGPDMHQFANKEVATRLLSEAQFGNMALTTVDCGWELNRPEELSEIFEQATVRAAKILAGQPEPNLGAIRSALAEIVRERFESGRRWRVPIPAALLRATPI
jgi:ubiquinone/menaquinone biosynthesis C-methylase UbiE